MKRFLSSVLIIAMMTIGIIATTPSAHAQSTADYSCGSYGAGNYSNGNSCDTTTAPNTGFAAKLTDPAVSIPLGLSILALVVGTVLLFKRRKKTISFDNR